jgi:hypothetical protein
LSCFSFSYLIESMMVVKYKALLNTVHPFTLFAIKKAAKNQQLQNNSSGNIIQFSTAT